MDEITYHPETVEIVERDEGYREFRCIPAHWTYNDARPQELLVAEAYSALFGVGRYGFDKDPDFWSASDACMRIRDVRPEYLDIRELAILATRRTADINRPTPWAAQNLVEEIAARWEGEATDIHPLSRLSDEDAGDLWTRYGMTATIFEAHTFQVYTGFDMRRSRRTVPTHEPWHGGVGTYYAWSTLLDWKTWPRRQSVDAAASAPDAGKLLLFVSHRWEDLLHPDPTGRQLLALKTGLTLSLAAAVRQPHDRQTFSGLPELFTEYILDTENIALDDPDLAAWAEQVEAAATASQDERELWSRLQKLETGRMASLLPAIRDNVLIWYDYASMYQTPRSDREEQAFRRELLLLNDVQSAAATVVLAGDSDYLSRAWCFLEVCGGIRSRIVELTPSWCSRIDVYSSITKWAFISDQLIGALVMLGPDAIQGSGLDTTHSEDLEVVANLISQLPLIGLVHTDGSDLVGGSIPLPFRSGGWLAGGNPESIEERTSQVHPLADCGQIPTASELQSVAERFANADSLAGECGIWVYTTQRTLSLAWGARADEFYAIVRSAHEIGPLAGVACTWADSRSLADDGAGWTRYIPSQVDTLIIATQSDLPPICRIYERIVNAHVTAGATVITVTPDTGDITVQRRADAELSDNSMDTTASPADVLAVPRIRRSTAYPRYLLRPTDTRREDIEAFAALRLDPYDGYRMSEDIAGMDLRALSERRMRAEAFARTRTSSWDTYATPRLDLSTWQNPDLAIEQLAIIEAAVGRAAQFSDNPLACRRLLYAVVDDIEDHYLLPPDLPEIIDEVARLIRESEEEDERT